MDDKLVLPERFWAKVQKTDNCWLWMAGKNQKGYGTFAHRKIGLPSQMAHRISYMAHKGAIPAGLQLDHLCRVKHCVNPDHLEVVTNRENQLRSPRTYGGGKTHCKNGHEFTEANTAWNPNEWGFVTRKCIACRREAIRKYDRRTSGYYLRHPEEAVG